RLLAWAGSRGANGWEVRLTDLDGGRERILRGHVARVTSLAFDRDGKRRASGGWFYDATIRLWDVADGRELAILRGHKDEVRALALAGDLVASADGENSNVPTAVRLWDARTGQLRTVLKVPIERVHSLAFAPDGRTLATAGTSPTLPPGETSPVILWNVPLGPERAISRPDKMRAGWCAMFSPDSKILATPGVGPDGAEGTVQLWEVATSRLRATLPGAKVALKSVAFTPDGQRLVAGGHRGMW